MFRVPSPQFTFAVISLEMNLPRDDNKLGPHKIINERVARICFHLYLLVSRIQSSQIRNVQLRLRLHGRTRWARTDLVQLLLPIFHLGATEGIKLEISGVCDGIKAIIQKAMAAGIFGSTGLSRWVEVRDEVRELEDLMKEAGVPSNGVKYLLTSLCGSRKLGGGWLREYDSDGYVDLENFLTGAADLAKGKLKDDSWRSG